MQRQIERVELRVARRMAISSQGLDGAQSSPSAIDDVLKHVGCLQIDAVQAVRRSQELVLLSRGVALSREADELYSPSAGLFETWGHAHSMMPRSMWPLLHWRRDLVKRVGLSGPEVDKAVAKEVLARISLEGPATYDELGTVSGKGWDRTSAVKTACEWLLSIGELVVVSRDPAWKRVYQTREQAGYPIDETLTVDDSREKMIRIAGRSLGIMTVTHLRDYFRFPNYSTDFDTYVHEELIRVEVEGIKGTWYADPTLLERCSSETWQGAPLTLLSPFDSLVWCRPRQQALFGKEYRLEIYKRATERTFGYFYLPILVGDRIIGRIAAKVSSGELLIENAEIDEGYDECCICEQAAPILTSWTGASRVRQVRV